MSLKKQGITRSKILEEGIDSLDQEELELAHNNLLVSDKEYDEAKQAFGDEDDYSNWRKADLVRELESRGLDSDGNKSELVQRLEEDDASD